MDVISRYPLRVLGVGLLSAGALWCGSWGYELQGRSLLAIAQEPAPIRLRNGKAEANGQTAGERSLAEMVGRDRRRKVCLGYAALEPNHRLTLDRQASQLRISVESEGKDTTLLILGPRGVDCNDNYRRGDRDAAVSDRNWPAGDYQIWVGAFEAGDHIDYQLRITTSDER